MTCLAANPTLTLEEQVFAFDKKRGWKTRSVFDRYNIVDEKDLADAAAKLDRKAQQRKSRHSSGTVTSKSSGKDESSSVY